jgi:hypothetical protein
VRRTSAAEGLGLLEQEDCDVLVTDLLLEIELFGHVKEALLDGNKTSAQAREVGRGFRRSG